MTKIAVIGCGPSGMFFLHAFALRRKRLEQEGNSAALALLPDVTCFERSSSPGGVWRSDRHSNGKNSEESTSMYEALWTNGPKECTEFFDYTFDEHFGCALPVFLPRELYLDYILARCTQKNPNFFRNVQFNTSVLSVTFNEDTEKFVIKTLDHETSTITEGLYDKCIWAAGINGKPKKPKSIYESLSPEKFKGTVIHSSEVGPLFDQCARGKKVLIIGDSYSAEDICLQAIKLGAETVDICSRAGDGIASETGSWPLDKVNVHITYMPSGVTDDGYGVLLSNGEGNATTLDKVDAVIVCTGYLPNMDMLDKSLRPNFEGPFFSEYDIPEDWKMARNELSDEFGHIKCGKILSFDIIREDIYRGHLISNPHMMFLLDRTENPILDLDIMAWLLLSYIMGDIPVPSQEQMKEFNLKMLLDAFNNPKYRSCEENFRNRWRSVEKEHWSNDWSDERMRHMLNDYLEFDMRILARDSFDAKYPLQLGSSENLSEKGKALARFNLFCHYHRYDLNKDDSWKTFRDSDPSSYYSIMTGTKAVPLKCRWLDIDGQDLDDIIET